MHEKPWKMIYIFGRWVPFGIWGSEIICYLSYLFLPSIHFKSFAFYVLPWQTWWILRIRTSSSLTPDIGNSQSFSQSQHFHKFLIWKRTIIFTALKLIFFLNCKFVTIPIKILKALCHLQYRYDYCTVFYTCVQKRAIIFNSTVCVNIL